MKKLSLLILVALTAASLAIAQTGTPGTSPPTVYGGDELGAHNGYGRGCVMCHAPHGGALGNGASATTDPNNGLVALWGENLTPYYGKTVNFGGGSYAVLLPSGATTVSISDTNSIVLLCLSCHDGSIAKVSMMVGHTYETLPVVGGTAPTLFGLTQGNTGLNYNNEHPVGPTATVSCGGSHSWDCTGGGNTLQPIEMSGAASKVFLTNNAASFWNAETCTSSTTTTWGYTCSSNPLSTPTGGTTVNAVTCTTCHDQHSMSVWTVKSKNYTTMFFIKGYYDPYNGGNSVAQFCRNCHGGESNEMKGLMNVPTW